MVRRREAEEEKSRKEMNAFSLIPPLPFFQLQPSAAAAVVAAALAELRAPFVPLRLFAVVVPLRDALLRAHLAAVSTLCTSR